MNDFLTEEEEAVLRRGRNAKSVLFQKIRMFAHTDYSSGFEAV